MFSLPTFGVDQLADQDRWSHSCYHAAYYFVACAGNPRKDLRYIVSHYESAGWGVSVDDIAADPHASRAARLAAWLFNSGAEPDWDALISGNQEWWKAVQYGISIRREEIGLHEAVLKWTPHSIVHYVGEQPEPYLNSGERGVREWALKCVGSRAAYLRRFRTAQGS